MADLLASAIVQQIFENLNSAAIQEIGRIWGLNDDLQVLLYTFTKLRYVADDEMLRNTTEFQKEWLRRLKGVAYDVEGVLDRMQYEDLRRRADSERGKFFPSSGLLFRIKMAYRLKNVRKKLDAIESDKNIFPPREGVVENRFGVMNETRQTTSLVFESEIYGRDEDKEFILVKLFDDNVINRDYLSVLAICGMGGLGKTTLAQLVYNDERVQKHFDLRMWVCVSEDFHVKRLMQTICECVDRRSCSTSEFDQLTHHLRQMLMRKRFLLVLDDVWNEDPMWWDRLRQSLNCGLEGSVVLVTTRNKEVAMMMDAIYSHDIGCLSEEHSWSLFVRRAFSTNNVNENLVPIGKRIVQKCHGVPLAIKAISSMMFHFTSEYDWVAAEKNGIWNQLQEYVTPALRLSYYNLDLQLRQCFAYCCIYPKDYVMEENHLIQLWIANGFIPCSDQNDIFSMGQLIFRKLAWRFFFQEINKNDEGNVTCKMHGLVHDLASSIMKNETYVVEHGMHIKIPKTVRHLYFTSKAFDDFMKKYDKFIQPPCNSLRSVVIDGRFHNVQEKDIISFLSKQKFLRVLQLQFQGNLSKLFCKLKHLKHLVMSCKDMKRLPNSFTSLYNLQTLNLMDSGHLLELPKDLRVMKKLCCLEMDFYDSLLCSPPGLGELTCLWRLPIFIVSENTSQQIGQLEKLNLRGNLCIKGLDNVSNIVDSRSANLINKMNLTSLTLVWMEEKKRKHGERVKEVLEGLQPHHNLEQIFINGYPGSEFPNWMGSSAFTNLKKVSLYNCESLPALGKLPSLIHLYLEDIISIRSLGVEWLGDTECSFPALTSLELNGMLKLEKWSIPDSMRSFPCLKELSIKSCPELKILPVLASLKSLTLQSLTKVDGELLQDNEAFHYQEIHSLIMRYLPITLVNLSASKTLNLKHCFNLEYFPVDANSLNCPESLRIVDCNNLTTFPAAILDDLPPITSLEFVSCMRLKPLLGRTLKHAPSLEYLKFDRLPELEGLPECMLQLTSLIELEICYCDEFFLPDWFGSLESLSTLRVGYCKNMKSFPNSFIRLKSLRNLEMWGVAEELKERCKKAEGEDWPKISRLPFIMINFEVIQDHETVW